jgi:hypothetical protein
VPIAAKATRLKRRPPPRPTRGAASDRGRLWAVGSPPKHAPILPSASSRKLPNPPTVQAPARGQTRQPRENAHGPPDGGRMVNGVRTDMVNEWLIVRYRGPLVPAQAGTQLLAAKNGFPLRRE